jgi:hypothetical protein
MTKEQIIVVLRDGIREIESELLSLPKYNRGDVRWREGMAEAFSMCISMLMEMTDED